MLLPNYTLQVFLLIFPLLILNCYSQEPSYADPSGPANSLFPYGDLNEDSKIGNLGQEIFYMQGLVRFHGGFASQALVSLDGAVVLTTGSTELARLQLTFTQINRFVEDHAQVISPAYLLAPYWMYAKLATIAGSGYYHQYSYRSEIPASEEVSRRAITFISACYPWRQASLRPDYILVVTWEGLKDAEDTVEEEGNTFQLVLVSSGRQTYAIFIYTSLSLTYPGVDRPGNQAGFASRNGSYSLPGSNTANIANLTQYAQCGSNESSVLPKGVYIFQIGETDSIPPSCPSGKYGRFCEKTCSSPCYLGICEKGGGFCTCITTDRDPFIEFRPEHCSDNISIDVVKTCADVYTLTSLEQKSTSLNGTDIPNMLDCYENQPSKNLTESLAVALTNATNQALAHSLNDPSQLVLWTETIRAIATYRMNQPPYFPVQIEEVHVSNAQRPSLGKEFVELLSV